MFRKQLSRDVSLIVFIELIQRVKGLEELYSYLNSHSLYSLVRKNQEN